MAADKVEFREAGPNRAGGGTSWRKMAIGEAPSGMIFLLMLVPPPLRERTGRGGEPEDLTRRGAYLPSSAA